MSGEIKAKAAKLNEKLNVREPDGIFKLACVASAHQGVNDRVALAQVRRIV